LTIKKRDRIRVNRSAGEPAATSKALGKKAKEKKTHVARFADNLAADLSLVLDSALQQGGVGNHLARVMVVIESGARFDGSSDATENTAGDERLAIFYAYGHQATPQVCSVQKPGNFALRGVLNLVVTLQKKLAGAKSAHFTNSPAISIYSARSCIDT
jgi:hypothetical protein